MKFEILKIKFPSLASTTADWGGKKIQKFKYLGNEKRQRNEIRSVFHDF